MARFYEFSYEDAADEPAITIVVNNPLIGVTLLSIDEELLEVLNDLQREFWRLERRESRHSVHIENIPDIYLPHERFVKNPEQILIEQFESTEIHKALHGIPDTQRRRFLLRYLLDYSIRDIAELEGCSERAVKYSIALAKNNLRGLLSYDDDLQKG